MDAPPQTLEKDRFLLPTVGPVLRGLIPLDEALPHGLRPFALQLQQFLLCGLDTGVGWRFGGVQGQIEELGEKRIVHVGPSLQKITLSDIMSIYRLK